MSENQNNVLLDIRQLRKTYRDSSKEKEVLKGVSFSINKGKTIGIVGLSGAGKSTIGKVIANLEQADSGQIWYEGQDLVSLNGTKRRVAAESISMVFQDPYEALSSRMRIADIVAEPLIIQNKGFSKLEIERKVDEALSNVSLTPDKYARRYPHELSGGERQRVGLARAFISEPKLLIADEPTSMLDSSLRLGLLACMTSLKEKYNTATLFITHDIALTLDFCDELIVLSDGEIVEQGAPKEMIKHPQHPFTKQLVNALLAFHL